MAMDDDLRDKVIGDGEPSLDFVKYDIATEFPFIHGAAKEHIKMCLPCAQKAMRHHSGVGNPLDEEGIKIGVAYISQISEQSSIILNQVQSVLIENQKQIQELNAVVIRISDLVEKNMLSNSEVLGGLKKEIKEDLSRFYKIVAVVATPLVIVSGFIISLFNRG